MINKNIDNSPTNWINMSGIECLNKTLLHDFTLTSEASGNNYQLVILVEALTYENGKRSIFWSIKCEGRWDYSLHPFSSMGKDNCDNSEHTGIVTDNEVSRSIIKYIVLTDDKLQEHSGSVHPACYRSVLIKALEALWD